MDSENTPAQWGDTMTVTPAANRDATDAGLGEWYDLTDSDRRAAYLEAGAR